MLRNVLRLFLCIVLPALLNACSKQQVSSKGAGCISRGFDDVNRAILTAKQMDTVRLLFSANHINLADYRPEFLKTSVEASGQITAQVNTSRFVNGLMLNNEVKSLFFFEGVLNDSFPYTKVGAPLNNDTSARLSLDTLRKIFDASDPEQFTGVKHVKDSCLVATLEYRRLRELEPNAENDGILVKTWRLQLSGGRPLALITDDDAKIYPMIFLTLY